MLEEALGRDQRELLKQDFSLLVWKLKLDRNLTNLHVVKKEACPHLQLDHDDQEVIENWYCYRLVG